MFVLLIKDGGIVENHDEKIIELNATYADLYEDGDPLVWEEMPPCPVGRLDGYSTQIGNLFYVFAGYGTIDHVSVLYFTQIRFRYDINCWLFNFVNRCIVM